MNEENEFTKPLKGYKPDRARERRRGVMLSAATLLVLGVPLFHFYDGYGQLQAMLAPPDQTIVSAVEPANPTPAVNDETVANKPALLPKREYQVDPGDGNLQPVTPQGSIKPLVPKALPAVQPVRRQELALAHLPDPELVERGATGVIPKKSEDGLRAMDVYSRQPDTEGNFGVARVVLVIGGLGISQTSTQQAIRELPGGVTLAFAPYGNSLGRWMQEARKRGHELLLQVPMEPVDYPQNNPGPHTLLADAGKQENLANLHWSMSRITNYVGVTNYLGGKLMQQPASLSPVFAELSKRGLLFFEDGSAKNSLGEGVALKELVPYAKADVLLDNIRSRSAIVTKLNKLSEEAKRKGVAIGMGNAFPDTISLVAEYVRQAKQNGIEITPVSAVVKDPAR